MNAFAVAGAIVSVPLSFGLTVGFLIRSFRGKNWKDDGELSLTFAILAMWALVTFVAALSVAVLSGAR